MTVRLPVVMFVLLLTLTSGAAGCSPDPEVAKRDYVRSGDRYVAQKKFREAVIEYRNALQHDSAFGEARLKLADSLMQVADFPGAAREYIRAADLLPASVKAQMKAGTVLLLGGRFEDAKARAETALKLEPHSVEAQILKANALAGLKDLDAAVAEVEEAIRVSPDRSASYASLAAIRLARGDLSEAGVAFKKAVETDPRSIPARLALARFSLAAGDITEGGKQLNAALELNPKHSLANRALAHFHIGNRRPAEAEPHLKVVAEAARDGSGKLLLGDYYVFMKRRDDARRTFESIDSSDARNHRAAQLRLAALALSSGAVAEAARLVEEVLVKQPTNIEALVLKADLLVRDGELEEAFVVLQSAVKANPQSARVHFALGTVQTARHHEAEAITAFNEVLKLNPRIAAADLELARLHLAAGRVAEAEQFAQSAVVKVPGSPNARLLLARIGALSGNTATAEKALEFLSAKQTNSPAIQTEFGLLELRKGNRVAARAALEKALVHNPAYVDALKILTVMDIEEKRSQVALARLVSALTRDPQNPSLLVLASATQLRLGDVVSAERSAKKALEVDPDHLAAYAVLGRLYASQNRLREATAEFDHIARRRPRSVADNTIVAILLDMQNRRREAQARYEQVIAIEPRAAVAANNLAWIYVEENANLDVALQLAQIAKSRLPDSAEVNDTLGWIYYKKGLGALAVAPLRESVQKDPSNPSYHYHLGMAYSITGDTEKARSSLRKALSINPNFANAEEVRQALARLTG